MVRNLKMTHGVDTQSQCPYLDSSFSSGDSASSSPSSSFPHGHASMTPSNLWVQSMSSQSAEISPQSAAALSLKSEDAVSQVDLFLPQDDYSCIDMLDGMTFFGNAPDFADRHQVFINPGMPKDRVGLDCADYRLAPYERSLQQYMPVGLGFQDQSGGLPLDTYNHAFSQQIFDDAETRAEYQHYLVTDLCTRNSLGRLPQTVVPSQTVTEPMTPSPGRDGSIRCPSSTGGSESLMDSLVGNSPLMTPSMDSSPVGKVSTRFLDLTIHTTLKTPHRSRSGRRPPRITKRGSRSARRSFDERIPVLVAKAKEHQCNYPQCIKEDGTPLAFERLEHLKRHDKSIHKDERPFVCKYCPTKCFSRNDNFQAHMNTHAKKTGRNDYILEEDLRLQRERVYNKLKRACRRPRK
ncbi:MAG: hypothetical protein M1830_000314 [Pleopsidium flavum]|nr:MAG: hypothetical protein M1830_000314 [Pleopsidium flavum]